LSVVILTLRTNDFEFCHPRNDVGSAAQGTIALVNEIPESPIELTGAASVGSLLTANSLSTSKYCTEISRRRAKMLRFSGNLSRLRPVSDVISLTRESLRRPLESMACISSHINTRHLAMFSWKSCNRLLPLLATYLSHRWQIRRYSSVTVCCSVCLTRSEETQP